MSIHIDRNICIGCGQCAEICPGTLIRMTDGKAEMRYPKECWGCVSCVKQCGFPLPGGRYRGHGQPDDRKKGRKPAALDGDTSGSIDRNHHGRQPGCKSILTNDRRLEMKRV